MARSELVAVETSSTTTGYTQRDDVVGLAEAAATLRRGVDPGQGQRISPDGRHLLLNSIHRRQLCFADRASGLLKAQSDAHSSSPDTNHAGGTPRVLEHLLETELEVLRRENGRLMECELERLAQR